MEENYSCVWWWKDPNEQWLHKVIDHIKASLSPCNDVITLHCENAIALKKSIPLSNYFFNLFLTVNSLGEEKIMFLNLKEMLSSIELYLGRHKKKEAISDVGISEEELAKFYKKYVNSFKEQSKESDDKCMIAFKEFLKQNNCIDINILHDFSLKCEKNDIKNNTYLILGTPSSPIIKQFISFLSAEKICTLYVETPLDASLHESPTSLISGEIKVTHELIEIKDIALNLEYSSEISSASEEYVADLFLSFLSLLVNSRNELSLSKVLISPIINLSHEAFTGLKHLSIEKEMPMCQVAISYVTRIKLGGKGYAPSKDCPMLRHFKGLELFVDTLNQMQAIIEEDSCPRSAIKRLINILKKKLLKCNHEKLKDSSIEAVAENLHFYNVSVSETLKSRISRNNPQMYQESRDVLYHYINILNSNSFIHDPDIIFAKKNTKRTPLNLPPLLGYFRSPEDESSCDTKTSINENSCLSRSSTVQSAFPSYFYHSESSEVSKSCVNSSTPSKLTFKDCFKEIGENVQAKSKIREKSQNAVTAKKNRKRSILSEITNENISNQNSSDTSRKDTVKKYIITSESGVKENAIGSQCKKQANKITKRSKKFKQIQGQGKITAFFGAH